MSVRARWLGAVWSASLFLGCGGSALVADEFRGPPVSLGPVSDARHLASDGAFIYWTEFSPGLLRRISRDGGEPETLATGLSSPSHIALNDTHVYVSTVDGVRRVPKATGAVESVADVTNGSTGLALDDQFVYFAATEQSALMRAPLEGGAPTTLADVPGPSSVALVGDQLCWGGGYTEPNSQVGRIPKAGGVNTTLLGTIGYVATLHADADADGARLYFRDRQGGGTVSQARILSLPVEGGEPRVLADAQPKVSGTTIDAVNVYWVGGDNRDVIYAAPKSGGPVRTLAEGQTGAIFLAQDGQALYWATQTSLMKLAR